MEEKEGWSSISVRLCLSFPALLVELADSSEEQNFHFLFWAAIAMSPICCAQPHTCGTLTRNSWVFITTLLSDSWVHSVSRGHRKCPWKIQVFRVWCLWRTQVYSGVHTGLCRDTGFLEVIMHKVDLRRKTADQWRPPHTSYVSPAVMESLVLTESRRSSADTFSVGPSNSTEGIGVVLNILWLLSIHD